MAVFQLSLPPALAEGAAGTEENRKIRSYLFQLTEQLRYTLYHLDDENFSEGGISPERIAGLGTEISKAAQAEIGKAKIGAAQIQHLEAQVAKIVTATLGTAVIDWAQIKELTAAVATIARAEIAAATIGWAQVEGVTANTALFTRTEADKLFAADLAVGDANIVDLNAGKINAGTLSVERLILVGTDKSVMYEINRANGTTELSQSTLDGGSITEKTITAEQIVAGGITAECLNVSEIFASEALVGKITSRHLDVSELFASQATAGIIHTNHLAADVGGSLNISANGAITLLTGRTEELAEGMQRYDAYFRFDESGLHLGKQGEALELNLRNDRIRFLDEHGAEVAYVSAGRLYISDAEITNRLRVSNYAWQKMQDGSLALTFDS